MEKLMLSENGNNFYLTSVYQIRKTMWQKCMLSGVSKPLSEQNQSPPGAIVKNSNTLTSLILALMLAIDRVHSSICLQSFRKSEFVLKRVLIASYMVMK